MGGGKWSKKRLGFLGAAVAALVLGIWLAGNMPRTYAAEEIDEELCLRLAPIDNGMQAGDTPLNIVEIRRVDDVIIAAYVWETYPKTMGYLLFEPADNGRYRVVANRSIFLMWGSRYSGGSEVFYTHDAAGNLKSYYILLTGHELVDRVAAYERTEDQERLVAEFAVGGQPAMCIWERSPAGYYTALLEDGSQLWERRFTSVQNWDDEISLDFMMDWEDCLEGGSGVLAVRVVLLKEPERKLGQSYIGVGVPQGIGIIGAQALAVSGGRFGYGHELVDSAGLRAQVTVGGELACGLDNELDNELEYEPGLHSLYRLNGYIRAASLRFGKGWRLRQAGDYAEAVFDYGDYVNAARPAVEWQVVWQVDNTCCLEIRQEMAIK